jgi:hypothetical protein
MEIAIVGGGFYGCYFARALERRFGDAVSVEIFDRDARPLSRAAINNQSRLHLGFHYPRSKETIAQTVCGYYEFSEEFADCIHFPSENLYAIHRDGLVNFENYLRAMDEFNLEYELCGPQVHKYFRHATALDGVIRVREGVIDLRKLESKMLAELKSRIHCSSLVSEIDSTTGFLVVNGSAKGPYDFIINATYVDPNLGLPKSKWFELKYELAAMVVMDAPFGSDVALTMMDGPYVSLYPCSQRLATLSSVIHTPFAKYDGTQDLETGYKQARQMAERFDVRNKILSHGEEILNLDRRAMKCHGLWISPKTKLHGDSGDTRISAIRNDHRLISVLCGKLDAVHAIAEKLIAGVS